MSRYILTFDWSCILIYKTFLQCPHKLSIQLLSANGTTVSLLPCFPREGSVVAHFWLVLSVPDSHVGKVTMERVSSCLHSLLGAYRGSDREETANYGEYLLHLPSFSITGERERNVGKGPVFLLFFVFS